MKVEVKEVVPEARTEGKKAAVEAKKVVPETKSEAKKAPVEAEETVAPEDVPLSSDEAAVLKLLGDCTHAWNVLDKKPHALKLGRQALERIKGEGIRPRMVAEVGQRFQGRLWLAC